LFDCNRQDVIAFDLEYIENSDKLETIRNLLREHGVKNIYEVREDGVSNQIIDFLNYEFRCSEPYFWNNECFWFDENMDWIIYVSHEGITTFGGKWFIEQIKIEWVDWGNNTSWDIKNKC
jgi:hypothetical protein